jgi:hypothetical protein
MKIKATVVASEFLKREYVIDCGAGNQFVHWIATTACMRFGQEHYPPGIYVPTLLQKVGASKDESDHFIPHPRNRINHPQSELNDGDSVIVRLKDRSRPARDEDEQDWYERAFGRRRTMMQYSMNYVPLFDQGKKGLCDFFIRLNYKMFPEL